MSALDAAVALVILAGLAVAGLVCAVVTICHRHRRWDEDE